MVIFPIANNGVKKLATWKRQSKQIRLPPKPSSKSTCLHKPNLLSEFTNSFGLWLITIQGLACFLHVCQSRCPGKYAIIFNYQCSFCHFSIIVCRCLIIATYVISVLYLILPLLCRISVFPHIHSLLQRFPLPKRIGI